MWRLTTHIHHQPDRKHFANRLPERLPDRFPNRLPEPPNESGFDPETERSLWIALLEPRFGFDRNPASRQRRRKPRRQRADVVESGRGALLRPPRRRGQRASGQRDRWARVLSRRRNDTDGRPAQQRCRCNKGSGQLVGDELLLRQTGRSEDRRGRCGRLLADDGHNPLTLWPMGWHQGNLVLAVVHACIFSLTEPPTEWHVSNATTATRVATIKGSGCVMSTWPSPAGVACADNMGATTLYDWGGKAVAATGPGIVTGPGIQIVGSNTALSPAGKSIFFSNGRVGPGSATRIVQLGPGPYTTVADHAACGWIDEDHLLSTDAVITFHAETPGNLQMTAVVTPLPGSALPAQSTPGSSSCAGRFPGGL